MPAKVVQQTPRNIDEAQMANTVWVSVRGGLLKARWPRPGTLLDPVEPARLGFNDGLAHHIAHWAKRYEAFREGLPYGYAPEHCIEFPLETFNAEGAIIAGEVAHALGDTWLVVFAPLERKDHLHVSKLLDTLNAQKLPSAFRGQPLPSGEVADEEFPGKWVRFMFDHCSGCLWNSQGMSDTAEGLPIDPTVASALADEIAVVSRAWEDWDFEESMRPQSTPEHLAQRKAFAEAGLALAYKVKAVLPADWTVVYFDIERAARRGLHSEFEYRI
ncbi:MAG: hypothetical protein RIS94_1414 [Pseudomonadota bacterium]|jgi:hypothetical protein